jgi:hypothetical protein
MPSNGLSFQHSSLAAIAPSADETILSFENVYADGMLRSAEVKLVGVTEILCDDYAIEKLELLEDDGEVLEFSEESGALSMTVAWVNFKQDTETEHTYRIACRSIVTTVGAISPDNPTGL